MGNWSLETTVGTKLNVLINMQASTIMHELGHNLGLRHGGNENTNYKPNYWSIMNYAYQLNGLDPDASSMTAYERWRYEYEKAFFGVPVTLTMCGLVSSPCGDVSQFVMSYSDGSGSDLNEASLLESTNVGRGRNGGTAYADWNMDGSLTTAPQSTKLSIDYPVQSNKNLKDHDDWGNLVLPFARQAEGNAGASLANKTSAPLLNPIFSDRQPVAEEKAPSASFFKMLRSIR